MKGKYHCIVEPTRGAMKISFYANTEKQVYEILSKNGLLKLNRNVFCYGKTVARMSL